MTVHRNAIEIAGKLMIAALFWWSGIFQGLATWPDVVDYVAARGFPVPIFFAAGAMALEILAPAGLFVRRIEPWAALVLAGYCVLTAVIFHPYWSAAEAERFNETVNFFKDLAIAGALLVIASRHVPQR